MNASRREIATLVEARAHGRCEYCHMRQALQGATFHVEHITPKSRGGTSEPNNLAWCCPACNLRKSIRIEAIDPLVGTNVPLFNPRQMAWPEHFAWRGLLLVGISGVGRATILALQLNQPQRVEIRRAEILLGLFALGIDDGNEPHE